MNRVVAALQDVTKEFKSGDTIVKALEHTSINVHRNELLLILGPSGSGKDNPVCPF